MDENRDTVNEESVGAGAPTPADTDADTAADPTHGPVGDPPVTTGNPVVDQVLRSVDDLGSRHVSEHVAVFEAAHEALRSALSDAGEATEQRRPSPGA